VPRYTKLIIVRGRGKSDGGERDWKAEKWLGQVRRHADA